MGRLFLLGLAKPPADLEPEPELEGLLTPVLEVGDADEGAVFSSSFPSWENDRNGTCHHSGPTGRVGPGMFCG